MLEVKDLTVRVGSKVVLRGVSLTVKSSEVHAVMGPNGSGKSSLAYTIIGRPGYDVVDGDILLNGKSILGMSIDERSRLGILLAFQEPPAVKGLRVAVLATAALNKRLGTSDLTKPADPSIPEKIYSTLRHVGLPTEYAYREVNVGFSGGEKKRHELFHVLLLDPKVVILDEPDSGLDVDGVRMVADIIRELRERGKAILLITHYARLMRFVKPDEVTILYGGRVAARGGPELAEMVESKGYSFLNGGER